MSSMNHLFQPLLDTATWLHEEHVSPYLSEEVKSTLTHYFGSVTSSQLVLALGAGALVAGVALQSLTNQKRAKSEPPMVPYYVPFIGSMIEFGMDPVKFLQKKQAKYGNYFTFLMFGRKMTYCLGPEGNNLVLNAKLANVSAAEAYAAMTTPVFGKDVVYDVPNHTFMEQKRMVKLGLSTENLKAHVPLIVKETKDFFASWSDPSGTRELDEAIAELIINTAASCLLGQEVRAQMDESIAGLYADLDRGFTPLNFLFPSLPFHPAYRRRDRAHAKMASIFRGVLERRRAHGETDHKDILQAMMEQKYKDGRPITDTEIAHMMIAILMGGQHTSSTTTTWAILYLTDRPDLVDALLEEQRRELGEDLPELTFDGLRNLPLLDAVIRETLRLRPPLLTLIRKVMAPIRIPGTEMIIPEGHYVGVSTAVTSLDPEYFPDPEKFEPRRWMDPEIASKFGAAQDEGGIQEDYGFGKISGTARSPYLPFGAGRHRCIGESFAYMQIKTILSTLIRDFTFHPARSFPKRDNTTLIATPEKPVLIKYKRRVPE